MAQGSVAIADVIVPELFTPYVQQMTTQKSRIISSGAVVSDEFLTNFLNGDGLTIHAPSFKDLEDDPDNVSSDTGADSSPNKIGTSQEIAVRLSRNNSWKSADLVSALITKDPADAIASRVADYWTRRAQQAFIATAKGVFANNATVTDAYHTQNDMTYDISGAAFSNGVTSFSAEAFIDATLTMGDSMGDLQLMTVHSVVYGRMQKNNLIEFIPDSEGKITIPTFLGRVVVVDDGMPFAAGVFESWLFGAGAFRIGAASPKVGTEVKRYPEANNGAGAEALFSRTEWAIHPAGYAYIGTPAVGGPSNAATANNLAAAASWRRAFTERKQIKVARLITREF